MCESVTRTMQVVVVYGHVERLPTRRIGVYCASRWVRQEGVRNRKRKRYSSDGGNVHQSEPMELHPFDVDEHGDDYDRPTLLRSRDFLLQSTPLSPSLFFLLFPFPCPPRILSSRPLALVVSSFFDFFLFPPPLLLLPLFHPSSSLLETSLCVEWDDIQRWANHEVDNELSRRRRHVHHVSVSTRVVKNRVVDVATGRPP